MTYIKPHHKEFMLIAHFRFLYNDVSHCYFVALLAFAVSCAFPAS